MRFLICLIVMMLPNFLCAQTQDIQARHSRYMDSGQVHHADSVATVTANSPRPLAQAVIALSEEYGWVVDFEDPPYYSKYDLVDDTDSKWRAAHPTAKGVTAIAGDRFQSQFPETPNAGFSPAEEEHILDTVVSDYNASTNPGRFTVRNEGDGRFAMVGASVKDDNGQDQSVNPMLDTLISIPTDTRDALTTIRLILDAVSAKTQANVGSGTMGFNVLSHTQVTVGGENIPARTLLLQTLSAAKVKLYWHLYHDSDTNSYALNVVPLMKANYDAFGNRTTVLVRRAD